MTAASVTALFVVWAIAVVSPGPDVVVVLQRSLAGRRHGLATAVGVVAGLAVWLEAAFAGVATLVRVYPQVMTVLQVAGGLLLASLGVLGLRGWWRDRATAPSENPRTGNEIRYPDTGGGTGGGVASAGSGVDVARGLLTNLANPKALVFFGAVLTPFLRGQVSVVASVAIVAGMIAIALAWFGGLALIASHRTVNERVGRLLPWVDLVASGLFVAVGVAFVSAAFA